MTESVHGHYKSQGNEHTKRWVFRRLQKTDRDCADISWHGKAKAFQVQAAVTGSDDVDTDHRRDIIPRYTGWKSSYMSESSEKAIVTVFTIF